MSHYELTPAAQRALGFATAWRRTPAGDELEPPQLLWGLLAEPECRAALLLAKAGVDPAAVAARWPDYHSVEDPTNPNPQLSAGVRGALRAAELRLADYPRPIELATEHLLLGLAVEPGEVADWLHARGLDGQLLEAEIHRLAGHQTGPLPCDPAPAEVAAETPAGPTSGEQTAALRILDAAANRAGEGLRVVEDYARFALDDRFLTGQCKSLRHDLAAALELLPSANRQAARDTRADVGTGLTLASEQRRNSLAEVVAANFKRVEQSLRSLEEYAKTGQPAAASAFEALRYRVYTLERTIHLAVDSQARLAAARLYVLLDGRSSIADFTRLAELLIEAGVDCLQLRDKRLPDRELLARARALRERTAGTSTLFIMNDRPDLALLARADGVHLGQDELRVKDARSIVGPDALIGVSTHSLEQARAAVLDGANYLGVGPTFASGTKQFSEFPGLELVRQVAGEIGLPAFAIGGVTADTVPAVRAAGLSRIAVCGAVIESADPPAAARELRRLLG